ncbi:MAG TPA: hypothetical protein VIW03_17290 [Anaeromyxobacter sp.]
MRAQPLSLGSAAEPAGTVVGRVCLDLDGDGRCGAGEPGVAGARILGDAGGVALADGEGRFHLLEVPARELATDRVARGGHALAAEGLGRSRAFELPPVGAPQVDVAVPPPGRAPPPPLAPAVAGEGAPERAPDGRLHWELGGRAAAGARIAIGSARAVAAGDGLFAVPVLLAPGETRLGVAVLAPGAGAIYAWKIHLARRRHGGDLVAPERPELLVAFDAAVVPAGALLAGRAPPGLRLRVGGVLVGAGPGGTFAAFAPARDPEVEILDGGGRSLARVALPIAPAAGIRSAVAVGEVEVSLLGHPGVLVTGRGAGAARGRLGPLELEAGVDLDDRDRKDSLATLARPRDGLVAEHALVPERSLAVAGDAGASDDRNPGHGRIWGRAEAEGLRLDLGSARAGITGSELGRYDRALFGAKARGEGAIGPLRLEASAFGATLRDDARGNAPPAPAHDVLAAGGGAALWLAHGSVVPGSEALRIEWRDPFTGRIVRQAALVRGADYEIDWASGRVILATPLASAGGPASLVTGDPFAAPQAAVVADYLHAAAGPAAEDLQGGRVGAALGPLSLSAHAAREQRTEGAWQLVAGRASVDLGPLLRIRAEAARSEGALFARGGAPGFSRSADGGYAFDSPAAPAGGADALHAEASGGAGPVRLAAWWRERQAGYSDAEFHEARAARERGAELSAGGAAVSASIQWAERRGSDPVDPSGLSPLDTKRVVARAGWAGERLGLVAEGVHAVREVTRAGEETSAGLRASWRVDPALVLDVSHHQGLRVTGEGRDPTFTAAGAELARGKAALAVRGGWGPELGPRLLVSGERSGAGEAVYGTFTADPDAPDVLGGRASTSALGARRRAGGAEVFTEEQFARDAFGLRTARVFGAALEPRPGLRLALSGERGERWRLDGSRADRRAAAASAGMALGPVRLAARGEVRAEGSDAQAGAGGSADWGPVHGAALSLRVGWLHGTFAGSEALGFAASLAGALRSDRGSLLASVSRLADMRPGEARRDGVVSRLAGTAAMGRVEAGLGAALALQRVAGGHDDRIAGSVRVRVRIAGPLDGAVEYARRAPLHGGSLGALDAARAEAGVANGESRLALGYTFVGFGGDGLTPAADTGRLYVRAQLTY